MEDACAALRRDYGDKLCVDPIAGDYELGMQRIR